MCAWYLQYVGLYVQHAPTLVQLRRLPYMMRNWAQFDSLQTEVQGHPVDWDHTVDFHTPLPLETSKFYTSILLMAELIEEEVATALYETVEQSAEIVAWCN